MAAIAPLSELDKAWDLKRWNTVVCGIYICDNHLIKIEAGFYLCAHTQSISLFEESDCIPQSDYAFR